MRYRLKATSDQFSEVDGKHAGMKYRRGATYAAAEIPDGKMDKFEPVGAPTPAAAPADFSVKETSKKKPADPADIEHKEE